MRILYVDIDTLRPDHLGCYGYARDTSPNIDAIAADGVRFTGYHCSDAPCLPSRAAMMTGRFGIHNGCVGHGGVDAELRHEGHKRGMADFNGRYNLPAVMRRCGMKTATISSFPDRHAAWWFYGGFDEAYNIGKRGLERADEVIPVALDWLARKENTENWFLHLHVWDPHIPYRTPLKYGEPFADQPLPDDWMTDALIAKHRAEKPGAHSACEVNGYRPSEDPATPRQVTQIRNRGDFRRMIDAYDTGVWYADKQLGRVFDLLKQQGIYDDMVIIVSSDHGENLGELGSYCEHGEADEVVTHIPLIVKWPGCAKNAVSDGFHYNVDLLPTLVDLLGGVPEFTCNRVVGKPNPADYDGQSFADCIRTGESGGREYLVVSQCAHVCQRGVRFGDWLYLRTYHDGYHLSADEELFNVAEDPHEQHDLAEERRELCYQGAWYLEHWVAEQMKKNIENSCIDPLWSVIHDGGPFHCRGYLYDYCNYLEETGRSDCAEKLRKEHPSELIERY